MALKVLMLRKKIDDAERSLAALREKDAGFTTREAELETAIGEAQTDEERASVEGMVDAFETEKRGHDEGKTALEGQLAQLRAELETEEKQQREAAKSATPAKDAPGEGRKDGGADHMAIRYKFFNLTMQERDALFAREEVRNWLGQVRSILRRDAGDVTNAKVLIPQVMLPFLRQIIEENTKLLKHVNLQRIPGEGRMVIDGGFPEAVWTEMCASINEVTIGFNDIVIGGWKVGAFCKVCNALMEDSDVALASEILTKLGQGVGYALDKAILYGDGTRMPLGIVPRLAQTAKPAGYRDTARAWADLHTSNIIAVSAANSTGIKLFESLVTAFGKTRNRFARGARFWAMSETTRAALTVAALSVNAAGAVVTGMTETMPVVGGAIETLDFIPNNVIIAGYDGLYLLAERAGMRFAQTEHRFFTEDQTAFRVTARYDGVPVIPEGFVAIGIGGTTVSATAVTFATDTANEANASSGDDGDGE